MQNPSSTSSLYIESDQKLDVQEQASERPMSAGKRRSASLLSDDLSVAPEVQRTASQDAIVQKLDATKKEVSHFRNIITFDSEYKQSYLRRSESETGQILKHLSETTTAIEEQSLEETTKQESKTFSTSLSEEDLEEARRRREVRKMEEEAEMWRETSDRTRISMEDVLSKKIHEHYSRGVVEASEGRFEAALTSLNKALNLRPDEMSCYVERGEAFLQMCDFHSAFINYKKALTFYPENPHLSNKLAFISYLEGQCLFDEGLFAEALECFIRAADLKPNVKAYHLRSITCLAALGRHQECLTLITRRLDAESTANPELYVLRARLHRLFGNITLSYYDVRDALSLDADQKQALVMSREIQSNAENAKQAALQLTLQNNLKEAMSKMTLAIQTDPSIAEYHVLRGALYRRVENFNSAIDDYLLAMDKSGHDEQSSVYKDAQKQLLLTYNHFAVHCYKKGFYEEAVILLNKAVKGEKREKGLYVNRGDCFFKLVDLGFALADYQQALEIDPTCWATKCRISVVQNEFGIAAYKERLYQDAVEYFSYAIENNGKVGQFYVHRARALYMMEEAEAARKDVLVALHLDPENDEIVPLISRLFPGRTVSEVLQSKMAEVVRNELASNALSHTKLPPMSRSISRQQYSNETLSSPLIPPPSSSSFSEVISVDADFPQVQSLPGDVEILQAKKQIVKELKNILNHPLSLKSKQPKVLSTISPIPSQPVQHHPSNEKTYYKWKSFHTNSTFK